MKEKVEELREKLHETIKLGNSEEILRVSQELDELINLCNKKINIKDTKDTKDTKDK